MNSIFHHDLDLEERKKACRDLIPNYAGASWCMIQLRLDWDKEWIPAIAAIKSSDKPESQKIHKMKAYDKYWMNIHSSLRDGEKEFWGKFYEVIEAELNQLGSSSSYKALSPKTKVPTRSLTHVLIALIFIFGVSFLVNKVRKGKGKRTMLNKE